METSLLHHDHDHVQISTTSTICEHILTNISTHTRQPNKLNTEDQHTKFIGLEPNFEKPIQISTATQLQSDVIKDQEDVITIQLESPECTIQLERPETNILSVNPTPENKSEDTQSTKLISELKFPPDYFQNLTTDDTNSSDENTIDDYYKIEHAVVNPNLQWTENLVQTPIFKLF